MNKVFWINDIRYVLVGGLLYGATLEFPPTPHVEQPYYNAYCSIQPETVLTSGVSMRFRSGDYSGQF